MTPRLLVTRPLRQAAELVELLGARGMIGIAVPTVEVRHEPPGGALDRALATLDGADWLVITSANGAEALAGRLAALGRRLPWNTKLAAVGPATAAALERAGLRVDHVPSDYLTVAIAAGLGEVAGRRIVLARADAATPDLADALRARRARVEEVVAYRTVEGPTSSAAPLMQAMSEGLVAITLTSGSTARGLASLTATLDARRQAEMRALPAYAIGPVTAIAARHAGLRVVATASIHTAAALADVIAATLSVPEI